ncbi:hypothetical protein D3C81_1967540 [compost metagenome]
MPNTYVIRLPLAARTTQSTPEINTVKPNTVSFVMMVSTTAMPENNPNQTISYKFQPPAYVFIPAASLCPVRIHRHSL